MKETKELNNKNGITLIALIITIIIMLILVSVTISMAINGGLFEKAGEAVGDTKNELNKEQELANGRIQIDEKWYASIDDYLAGKYQMVNYDETKKDEQGFLEANATYVDGVEEKPAVIPAGYKIVNEGEKIANGIVIADSKGNEFVWIPVNKAIVTESEIAKIKEEDSSITTNLQAVQKLINSGTYPMAVQVGENYKGILYDFSGTDTLTLTVRDWTSKGSYREPANLTHSKTWESATTVNGTTIEAGTSYVYDSQEMFTLYGLGEYTDILYQTAYNKMVESVAKNGGFYVGRYEISEGTYLDANNNSVTYAQSQADKTALTKTWYEMYKYEREYANSSANLEVASEMIWGSQWDQMMIFVNGKNDGEETPAKFYVAESGSRQSGDISTKTGKNTVDQVANIFDLEASRCDWTQEAYSLNNRVIRGGSYKKSAKASGHYYYNTTNTYNVSSSRVALYIK